MATLYKKVRRILWDEWDPIGVRKLGGLDGEYDSYVLGIVQQLEAGRDAYAIVNSLSVFSRVSMGLSIN